MSVGCRQRWRRSKLSSRCTNAFRDGTVPRSVSILLMPFRRGRRTTLRFWKRRREWKPGAFLPGRNVPKPSSEQVRSLNGFSTKGCVLWSGHSCLPRRDSSRRGLFIRRPQLLLLLLACGTVSAQTAREIVQRAVALDQANLERIRDYTYRQRQFERQYDS